MNDNELYNSILNDVEDSFNDGNILMDPFNLLDVQKIKFIGHLSDVCSNIDMDNLYNETEDFDIDNWEYLLDEKLVLVDDELKYILLRLAWWFCREILCTEIDSELVKVKFNININSIFPLHNKKSFYIYNYSPGLYRLVIDIPGNKKDEELIINFKNIENL